MHRHSTGSGEPPAGRPIHRMASPPPPNQTVTPSGMTSPEPHQSPPSFSQQQPTHPLQQFLMGTAQLQGLNINLRGGNQPVLHTRISPTAVAPGVVPIQTGSTSPIGYQQQLSPQAMARQLHPSTQAFLQMSCLQGQAIPTSGVSHLQRPVLNVPLSPGRSYVDPATGIPIQQVNISASSSVQQQQHPTSNNPFVFQDVHKTFPDSGEAPISQESLIIQNLLMPTHHQPMGTIHHLGQGSPGRSSMPPLSSPVSGSPRRSSSHSPTRGTPGHKSPTGGGYRRPHSPARTSPLPSSPSLVMRKTMMPQTEERPPANAEVAELRRQVLQERLTDIKKLKDIYNEKLTELFFLQNGGNMMDFLAWKKRPNQQLFVYLSSQRMDDEEEKTINDEVKVITNSGSNIPVGTPVAISTQLPPAVSALSSQLNQKAREQKAREMRRSLPGTIQAAAAAAAGSAAAGGEGEASRKRSFAQAGLDSGSGQDKKVQLMHSSSHEPNVTVTPSMMTAIPTTHSLHQLKFPSPSSAGSSPTSSSTQGTPAPHKTTPTLSSGTTPIATAGSAASPSPNRTALKQTPLSPTAQQRLATRQQSLSAVYDYTIGSQEMIVEKAKQEAQVMQRIAELRKEGVWAAKRLPKVQEPPRQKTHWDYLLEEMQWLATDFAQERRWKRASARKLVRAVARHHQEQHAKEVKAEKEESQKLQKIAANMAKEITTFWANIEKVVQYKQQSRLEERRKRVMDLQLDYIVGQTEKYSSWLTEGLNLATSSTSTSIQGSLPSSPRSEGDNSAITGDDVDFQPVGDDSDDEETIDVAEKADEADADARAKEIELLQKESELPLEDLLSSLPPGIYDKPGSSSEGAEKDDGRSARRKADEEETSLKAVTEDVKDEGEGKQDEEFVVSADEDDEQAQDEEDTLEEQEAAEGTLDHKKEIAELEAEGDLPIEELMKRYSGAYEDEYEYPRSEDEEEDEDEDSMDDTETEEEEDEGTDGEEEELADIGMEYLIHPENVDEEPKPSKQTGKGEPNKEITDIAAAAQSLQPTGYTLSTTQVKTKVPFLLRHTLREYQHIGLDWMVTLHEKKLNGILADEMGLGKTIQTIALLAHLACEEENWGPHLIVVPTSVMLNWEMELKKWCPGFKILTYYGNQKERKQKRQGWTKCNAFHVCITSYKLVIQDHQSFRRKKWKYLVLDEAQNIKNFKSQRWQTLLNFNSQRRLLLTGTPLQNNLMELWSLMHFLMPHVFASHREFREWFSNPLSGMIEGTQEYNESLIRRLHKVLRPFLLRRLKSEVEKQLPQKYEHVVRCRLSKRQRFLYEDFMSRTRTRETLATGHFMSVINVLMQLRKVCNHPDLFEARPIFSPFQMEGINFYTASLALRALEYDPFKHVNLFALNFCIADIESLLPAYAAHRMRKLQTPRKLIEEIDSSADIPPRLPKLKVKPGKLFTPVPAAVAVQPKEGRASPLLLTSGRASPMQQGNASPVLIRTQQQGSSGRSSPVVTQFLVRSPSGTQLLRQTNTPPGTPGSLAGMTTLQLTGTSTPGTFTLVSTQSPLIPGATPLQQLPGYTGATTTTSSSASAASVVQQRLVLQQQIGTLAGSSNRAQFVTSQPITLQLQNRGQQGARIAIPASQLQLQSQSGGIVRIVQTPSGQQIVRQAPQASVISQQTLLQQQQLLQLRQQQQRQLQQQQQQQVTLQSVAGGQQVTVNSQQLVNSIVNQVRTQASAQPAAQTNQVTVASAAGVTPQLARIQQQPQLSAVAQVQNALQQQQQQQQFLQQLQQQQLRLQQPAAGQTSAAPSPAQVVSVSAGLAQTMVSSAAGSSTVNQTEAKQAQSIPKLQTVATTSGARTTTTPSKTYSTAAARKAKREAAKKSPFYLESLTSKLDDDRKDNLSRIATINRIRCMAKPIYGQDLFSAVSIYSGAPPAGGANPLASGIGHVFSQCVRLLGDGGKGQYQYTDALRQMIRSPDEMLCDLEEIIKRYAIVIPLAEAPPITLHTSHPPPSFLTDHEYMASTLDSSLKPRIECLHDLRMAAKLQFPELRLIQYDCGKLQALGVLLHKLKAGSHRVLIFTQMTKMLDVLERFLNYYGYIYLRLDGATRVEQRQVLMERFNADPRIFVFILSTRSGGIGVNLTGADTVIFYDSDWNPTMDAQAQDRCHRIGQTRDVHIYRLVSEMTVEENILKKANQKRLLVDVSIEGGNFTTAFFREHTIKELFDMSTAGNLNNATELVVEDLKASVTPAITPAVTPPQGEATPTAKQNLTKEQLEQALARTEDETDVQAASKAHAEQDAELAEFDEDIPYEGEEGKKQDEPSKVEIELAQLDDQLTPIEKYAMKFLENTLEPVALEELKEAEEQIEEAKKEWELGRLKAIKEEEERRAEMEEDEILFTYSGEDAQNKVLKNKQAKSKKNRASSRTSGSNTPNMEKRATRSTEPRLSTRSTRSNASSPVLRSRNASPERPTRITSPTRPVPGSPTRTKVASPDRSVTLRSDRGSRLRSSDEPLSPPLSSSSSNTSVGARSRRPSSSSVISDTAKSPPYNAVPQPTHGWSTRSKRNSVDIEFVDIREVEKRAKAAAVAAAEKKVPLQQQQSQIGKAEDIKSDGVVPPKDEPPVHVNSVHDGNHEETAESILENIQKLTATIENELKNEPEKMDVTVGKQSEEKDISVMKAMLPETSMPEEKDTKAVLLNVPKVGSPPSAAVMTTTSPLEQLATVVQAMTSKMPAQEQPIDLCVNPPNGQPMDLSVTTDAPVDLTTKPASAVERPRTPILEKLQSESPTASPQMPSSPKLPIADEPNVFERMRFPAPKAVRQLVSAPPLPKPVVGERLGLFDKIKSTFALKKSTTAILPKKEQPQETADVVVSSSNVQESDAFTESVVHIPESSDVTSEETSTPSEPQVEPGIPQPMVVDNEVTVVNEKEMEQVDSIEETESPVEPPDSQIIDLVDIKSQKDVCESEVKDLLPPNVSQEKNEAPVVEELKVNNEAPVVEELKAKPDEPTESALSDNGTLQSDTKQASSFPSVTENKLETLEIDEEPWPELEESEPKDDVTVNEMDKDEEKEIPMDVDQPVVVPTTSQENSASAQDASHTVTPEAGPISVEVNPPPVSTPESVSAVARLHMVQALSPGASHSITSNRSKSPSPDRPPKSPVFDVPKASTLLSGSPTPENPLSSGAEIPKYPSQSNIQEVNGGTAATSEITRTDNDEANEVKKPEKGGEFDGEKEVNASNTQDVDKPDVDDIQVDDANVEHKIEEKPTSEEVCKDNGDDDVQPFEEETTLDASKPALEPCEPSSDTQLPLHLQVDEMAAPSLVKQSPGSRSEIQDQEEHEREMPQISPVYKLVPPATDKQDALVDAQAGAEKLPVIDRSSPAKIDPVVNTTSLPTGMDPASPAKEDTEAEKLSDVKDISSDVKVNNNSEDEEKMSADAKKASAGVNHVENDKEDDSEASSDDDDESSGNEDKAPRTTRAKAALIAAQQRRQLRSEGRGALLQPLSYKPTLHKGKVVRGRSHDRTSSQSAASQSDSSPSPRKRGPPSKSPAAMQNDSDSSPQRSPTSPKRGRGRPRKYPRIEGESSKDMKPKVTRMDSSQSGKNGGSDSDSSAQGSTRSTRRNCSSPDTTSTSIDRRTAGRTRSKSVAAEIELGAHTRSRRNSAATSHASSRSSSAANSRDSSPARAHDAKSLTRQRKLSERVRSTRS